MRHRYAEGESSAPLVVDNYESRADGFEETLEIAAAPEPDFMLRATLSGSVRPALEDGALVFSDDGAVVLRASAPRAWDATGRSLVTAFVLNDAGVLALSVRGAVSFPVRIDPVWESTGDAVADAGFGVALDGAGDVNGDGYDDIVIGALSFSTSNPSAGRAYLYLGSPTGPGSFPDWFSSGDDVANAAYGFSVAGIGDTDGDGYDELAVGAPTQDGVQPQVGRTFVYAGASSGVSTTPIWAASESSAPLARFGRSFDGADVNGDGYADLVVSAPYTGCGNDCGTVYAYYGSASGLEVSPSWTESGVDLNDLFGFTLASAGDVDGDGCDDVLIGMPNADPGSVETGQAFLYRGSAGGLLTAPSWVPDSGAMKTLEQMTLAEETAVIRGLQGIKAMDPELAGLWRGYRRRVEGLVTATEALMAYDAGIEPEDVLALRDELAETVEALSEWSDTLAGG